MNTQSNYSLYTQKVLDSRIGKAYCRRAGAGNGPRQLPPDLQDLQAMQLSQPPPVSDTRVNDWLYRLWKAVNENTQDIAVL